MLAVTGRCVLKRFVGRVANFASASGQIQIGERIGADIEVHSGFPPEKVNVAEYIADRKVALLGLPGAFTPT